MRRVGHAACAQRSTGRVRARVASSHAPVVFLRACHQGGAGTALLTARPASSVCSLCGGSRAASPRRSKLMVGCRAVRDASYPGARTKHFLSLLSLCAAPPPLLISRGCSGARACVRACVARATARACVASAALHAAGVRVHCATERVLWPLSGRTAGALLTRARLCARRTDGTRGARPAAGARSHAQRFVLPARARTTNSNEGDTSRLALRKHPPLLHARSAGAARVLCELAAPAADAAASVCAFRPLCCACLLASRPRPQQRRNGV
jgi:hypothetical protein